MSEGKKLLFLAPYMVAKLTWRVPMSAFIFLKTAGSEPDMQQECVDTMLFLLQLY